MREIIEFLSTMPIDNSATDFAQSNWRFLVNNLILLIVFLSGFVNLMHSYILDEKSWFCESGSTETWQIIIYPIWAGGLLIFGYTFSCISQYVIGFALFAIIAHFLLDLSKNTYKYKKYFKLFERAKKAKKEPKINQYKKSLMEGF